MSIEEHAIKETCKVIIDNSPKFGPKTKHELKTIIDAGRNPEETCAAIITYFAVNDQHQ